MQNQYDVVIIGSGLGGLECGVMLSKEGYNVCVLEQSKIFGGCLQSFNRKGRKIDTGIHYVGSMDQGQIMRQYLKYFNIFDRLNVKKLDNDFDVISLGDTGEFKYRNGYENFIEELSSKFPNERGGIERYCREIRDIGESISVDVCKTGKLSLGNIDPLSVSAVEFINECVTDPTLRNVLAGTNTLYGATKDTANLYHHAMINHSNIESAYRFVGGTQNIADLLIEQIEKNGGTLLNDSKVTRIGVEDEQISCVELENGEIISGKYYISSLHPANTFNMLEKCSKIKKAYKTRLNIVPNTYGIFSVYLLMKSESVLYANKNFYRYDIPDVWDNLIENDLSVKSVLVSSQVENSGEKYSNVITLMSPMADSVFKQFENSKFGAREAEYKEIKEQLTQNIIDLAVKYHPELNGNIDAIYSSTPITYQHYTETPLGSAYGMLKSYKNSLATLIPTRTKIPNLFLTGQSLNVHGAVGVTITAANTCANILGEEYLAKKIGNI